MLIIFSEKCLEYWDPGHLESPDRVYLAYKMLKERGFKVLMPEPCSKEDLLLVHSEDFVNKIMTGAFNDPDTPNLPRIYDYARLSVGSAIKSMEMALKGEKTFSLMRPPGHHAGINGRALGASSLGFCYFNNIAIACKKALTRVNRVAVIDIDCHHGNGTQEILFGNSWALYVSLHKYDYVYPGTGGLSEGNCLNYPFRSAVDDSKYLETLESALREVDKFDPDLIGVSAGFDGHRYDPVCGLGLSEEVYTAIGKMISELGRKTFAVLEGGYGKNFPKCVLNFILGLEQS